MSNKYLEKIAETAGTFMGALQKTSVRDASNQGARASVSGLPTSPTVKGGIRIKPPGVNPSGLTEKGLMGKIASFITDVNPDLPYRRRVEIAIFKDGKVLLTKNKDKDTGDSWYGFPGGGTEGDTDEEAARKECLEEVGISLDNLSRTDILDIKEGIGSKNGRDKKYRGSRTRMFTADYKAKDTSKLGNDGDSVKYIWSDISEAKKLLKANKVDSTYRVKTLDTKKES